MWSVFTNWNPVLRNLLTVSPGLDISSTKILAAANQMVSLGLKSAGYQYVNIDVSMTVAKSLGKAEIK